MSPISGSTFENSSGGVSAGRIYILDLWRSVCVWMMIVYHTAYDLTLFGALPETVMDHPAARAWRYLGAGSFILISGICVRFSRSPVHRGFLVFCTGALVSVVTALAGYPVAFGILQLLGCCMILYGVLWERLERRNGSGAFAAACAALFAGTWALTANAAVPFLWLYPLGLKYPGFYSSDYFPLLPWIFLFLLGTCLGKWLDSRRDAPLLRRSFSSALTFCGRHSLHIYLLHQPLIYGVCCLVFTV